MQVDRSEAVARLRKRATEDTGFRRALLADPHRAIEEEFGAKLPANVTVNVIEEQPDDYFIVLPLNPEGRGDVELTDEQLEAVAGGGCYCDCGCDVYCDI